MRHFALLLAALLTACAAPPPAPTPASATPAASARGAIRGRVLGAGGETQLIGLAVVSAGRIATYTANPKDDEVVAEDFSTKDQDNISVMHDGELVTRIIRQDPPTPADRYAYLRLGEYLLEGVPAGPTAVEARFSNVTSTPRGVTVPPAAIAAAADLELNVPEPPLGGGPSTVPRLVELSKAEHTTDPLEAVVTLKSPPGSPGTVLKTCEIDYAYDATIAGPQIVQLPPTIVPPASEIAFGPPLVVRIPLSLDGIDAERVTAYLTFKDDRGFDVPTKDLNTLRVTLPLRR